MSAKCVQYDFSESVLELALRLERFDFISLLVENGADISSYNSWPVRHQRWLKALECKKTYMMFYAGAEDENSTLFMMPREIIAEIFSKLI